MINLNLMAGGCIFGGILGFMFALTFQSIKVNPYWGIVPAILMLISILLMIL